MDQFGEIHTLSKNLSYEVIIMTYSYERKEQGAHTSFVTALEEREGRLFRDNSIPTEFSHSVSHLTAEKLIPLSCFGRLDFRSLLTFAIDCDDTKDRDDALSISYDGVFHLGVHIADVSAYVVPFSPLDQEAMERGTSIYLPNRTIPMLPEVLSNDLCSLGCEDRLTVSTMMDIDNEGNVLDYRIEKTIIHPSLTGTYSQVNALLSGRADNRTTDQYSLVYPSLILLRRLSKILRERRMANGADTASDKAEAKIGFQNGTVVLFPRATGIAEMIIEEAMVQANACVADFFRKNNLPAVYRVQGRKGTLAEYQPAHLHHASLALENYAHTTSPIRRLPDLRMQQILTVYLGGCSIESLH